MTLAPHKPGVFSYIVAIAATVLCAIVMIYCCVSAYNGTAKAPSEVRAVTLVFLLLVTIFAGWFIFMSYIHPLLINTSLPQKHRVGWVAAMTIVPGISTLAYAIAGSNSKTWRNVAYGIIAFVLLGLVAGAVLGSRSQPVPPAVTAGESK